MLLSWQRQDALVRWTPHEVILYKPAPAATVKHPPMNKKQKLSLVIIGPKMDTRDLFLMLRLSQVILDGIKLSFPLILAHLPPSPLEILRSRMAPSEIASVFRPPLLITYTVPETPMDLQETNDHPDTVLPVVPDVVGEATAIAQDVVPGAQEQVVDTLTPLCQTPERPIFTKSKTSVNRNIFVKRKTPADEEEQLPAPPSSSPTAPVANKKRRTRLGITLRPASNKPTPLPQDSGEPQDANARRTAEVDEESWSVPAKRTLGEVNPDADSAHRVLKKPFKPLTLQSGPRPSPARPKRTFASAPTPAHVSPRSSSPPFPEFKPRRIPAMRPPRQVNSDPTSSPSTSSRTPASKASRPRSQIAQLERTVFQLRQAVKYALDPTEDERLEELVGIWRQAGRDAVENLFSILPQPDLTSYTTQQNSNRWQSSTATPWGWDDREKVLTDAELEYLRHAPRNADGDAVDEQGNLLLPPSDSEDLFKMLAEGSRSRSGAETYQPLSTYRGSSFDSREVSSSGTGDSGSTGPAKWDYAAVMRQCSVDPALLGWDADAEDWTDL